MALENVVNPADFDGKLRECLGDGYDAVAPRVYEVFLAYPEHSCYICELTLLAMHRGAETLVEVLSALEDRCGIVDGMLEHFFESIGAEILGLSCPSIQNGSVSA